MADISFESLALLFITVLLASLIGGLITVHYSQRSNKRRVATPNLNKSRKSNTTLSKSVSPNRATHANAALIHNNNSTHHTPQKMQTQQRQSAPSSYSPQYTQTTVIPQMNSTLFQYPISQMNSQMNAMYNAPNMMHDPLHNPQMHAIPPAPHHPPASNSISPQHANIHTNITPSKTHSVHAHNIQASNFNPQMFHNQYHQPSKGNISNLHNRDANIAISKNQQNESFTSSQRVTFNSLNKEIMKFPAQSSTRVTFKKKEQQQDDGRKSRNAQQLSLDANLLNDGQKMNFFNLPPINKKAMKLKVTNNNLTTNAKNATNNNNSLSFPDNLPPSELLSPSPQQHIHHHHSPQQHHIKVGAESIKQRTRLIIVCYKLPLKCVYNKEETQWEFEWEDIRNVLANLRVLQSRGSEYEVVFVGWPGITPTSVDEQEILEDALYGLKYACYPIFLSESQITNCYKIYCRSILWPLFHYKMPTNDYQFGANYEKYWQNYVGLNNLYAKKACVAATDRDSVNNNNAESQHTNYIIWFHDYHLLLAPHYVRRQIPLAQIGLFLHTTFPTSEVFRCLPTRKEILRGILSSDLVGFHTYDYARHFLSACKRILDLDFHTLPDDGTLAVHYLGRDVSLRIGHASILSHDIHKLAQSQKVKMIRNTFWRRKLNIASNKKIILGLGELDEVRGTILTIQSFHRFLDIYPEWQNDIIFILYYVSSHDNSNNDCTFNNNKTLERSRSYSKLRQPIEDEINKMCQQYNSDVIQLIDSNHLSFNELLALYTLCDVAVFGTIWDGFNTAPYEFTAAQPSYSLNNAIVGDDIDDERGVPPAVILSEFMGCMRSLCGVFRINPWKTSEVASTLHTALCMTSKERRVAHHRRFSHVMKYTLVDWSKGFLNDLIKAAKSERNKRVLPIGFGSNLRFIYIPSDLTNLKQTQKLLLNSFKRCKYKVLLLDYGGTLTDVDEMKASEESMNNNNNSCRDLLGITKDLQTISPKILYNLKRISSDQNTIVAILSGQTRENLDAAFRFSECPNLFICAEKGAYFRYPNAKSWVKNEALPSNDSEMLIWQNIVHDVLKIYTERTNGSYIQKKATALVWHYENADPHYGDMQATEAERYLRRIISKHHNLLVQRYDHCRALEVLPKEINKGAAALKVIDCMMKHIDYNNDDTTGNNIWFMAVGNDRSDEKMFEAVELVSRRINTEYGFTVRIGMAPTQARFYLTHQNQMLWLLNTLAVATNATNNESINDINIATNNDIITTHTLQVPPPKAIPIETINFNDNQLVSPEYNGSFFDNVAVRSHSYTSLSKLARLSQLNEVEDIDLNKHDRDVNVPKMKKLNKERSI